MTFGPDPLHQIARRVESLDRARALFRDQLGLTELYSFPGLAFFRLGATRLMLRETGSRGEADSLYFRTDDIVSHHALLGSKGIVLIGVPHCIHSHADGTEEWMAFFEDDEGRPLALASLRDPTGPEP